VPAERANHFRDRFGAEAAEIAGGSGRIDLRAANIALLSRAGVAGITVYDDCTACSPTLISFRAERAAGRDGSRRMAALLGNFEG
jgi:copper oxidase (laccase) domain-containing protein